MAFGRLLFVPMTTHAGGTAVHDVAYWVWCELAFSSTWEAAAPTRADAASVHTL